MKQKPTKKTTKKAEPSARKKPVIKKKADDEIGLELYEMLKSYKPNHFKFALNEFGYGFRSLWLGIKALFKK